MSDKSREMPAVSAERWQQAQAWELQFWNRQNIPSPIWKRLLRPFLVAAGLRLPLPSSAQLDDRNLWWMRQFEEYNALPRTAKNVCELGCGPYTNIHLISNRVDIKYIHCSDPLAPHYIKYPRAWVAEASREGRVSVDFHAAEDCPYKSDYFDITVMINVLDHVRDPARCLREAMRITAPEGYLVFGQDLTGQDDSHPSNPGHPILVDQGELLSLLREEFREVVVKIVPREEMHEPDMHYGALVYIGRKKKKIAFA